MMRSNIPNYQIDDAIASLDSFTNYNGTIRAHVTARGNYGVYHWNTQILEYDAERQKIVDLYWPYISQTTSTLVGRIVRNLPRQSVLDALEIIEQASPRRGKQIRSMARI